MITGERLHNLQVLILRKLVEEESIGVTRFDFPDYPELTEETMEQVINSVELLLNINASGGLQ